MLNPRLKNSWREYACTSAGYGKVSLLDCREIVIMRASHGAHRELEEPEAYWEVYSIGRSSGYPVADIIFLRDIKDEEEVIKINAERRIIEQQIKEGRFENSKMGSSRVRNRRRSNR